MFGKIVDWFSERYWRFIFRQWSKRIDEKLMFVVMLTEGAEVAEKHAAFAGKVIENIVLTPGKLDGLDGWGVKVNLKKDLDL